MYVRRGAAHVEVQAPAKLNLFLEVLGKRPDGFHEIETVMTPVSLFDTLEMFDDPAGELSLGCDFAVGAAYGAAASSADAVPTGADNLVLRALNLLRSRTGARRGARVRLVKRIPVAAGLAGGSTDAAAALAAGNLLWDLKLNSSELADIAASLGSDIPFFFTGGPAVCRGRGERIEPLTATPTLYIVIVKPAEGLSTADVYRACRPAARPAGCNGLVDAWRCGSPNAVGACLHNRLQEAAESLNDCVARTRREFAACGATGHQMSGSGTSYFAVCRNAREARTVAARLAARRVGRTFVVRTLQRCAPFVV